MAALEVESPEVKGLLNLTGNLVLQPERIESSFKNPDSSWTYLIRWKDIWLHETMCMNFPDLVEEYWRRQESEMRVADNTANESKIQMTDDVVKELPNTLNQFNEVSELRDPNENFETAIVNNDQNSENIDNQHIKLRLEVSADTSTENMETIQPRSEILIEMPVGQSLSDTLTEESRQNLLQALSNVPVVEVAEGVLESFNYQVSADDSQDGQIADNLVSTPVSHEEHTERKQRGQKSRRNLPAECDLCHKILSSRNSLREHRITVHFKNGRYPCDECDKRFTHQRALKLHKVMHSKERNYICDECGSSHKRERELQLHIRDMHTSTQNFRCDVCFQCFKMKGQLKTHCFTEHRETVTNCIVCQHKLTTPFSIYTHCLKHSVPKEFLCPECNRAFQSKGLLSKHMSIHDPNRKPYKECPKCNKWIYSRSHYYEHINSHTENTNEIVKFQCPACDATFQHSSSLKRHKLRHRPGGDLEHPKENPYLNMEENLLPDLCCRICRKLYTSKSGYYEHAKKCRDGVTTEAICEYCNKTFSSKKTMTRHIKRLHRNDVEIGQDDGQLYVTTENIEVVAEENVEVEMMEEIAVQIVALAPATEDDEEEIKMNET